MVLGVCDSSPSTRRSQTDGTPISTSALAKKLQKVDEEGILELVVSRN